ncbi:TetR/AcrR family transcriptional regulator [Aureimonas altamirensis]|jgi:AcrR family transcriptional regulator|uniref:Transcriptional regulator, TetR family n=1 Tax=Aureimonas altamirensis DSM 21988 TaxID=1121026 RepID=A0ABY1IER3_9HYPH|nr:TetR/AcrR family transcriptional regulator [Aureimonas altamirensis]UHD46723.1 TetR/AcrR family transcriptional regulator [Aureimonas altamirensis]SHJ07128.1 transcriptional regulator, TetR family [Aureimonas altamirensis DSM 21988]
MGVGRPREFDPDVALDRAMELFWRQGYEGTSLSDLTEAMGIAKPSLYAVFGNKEELFRKALDRYASRRSDTACDALNEPTSRRAIEMLLLGFAGVGAEDDKPKGCLMVQGALVCSEASETIRRELCDRRAESEAALCRRMQEWKAAGDLPDSADPEDLARYVMTVANGIAVQAASGASKEDLRQVVEMTMRTWPPA